MSASQMYTARVICDSISSVGQRLTTVKVVYPHAVHKDMLRHRCMNRNVESFRAQPPEKLIEALRNGHAFKPDVFAKRTKGMGQSADEVTEAEKASWYWDQLLERALITAERLLDLDVAKQQINFVLQDFCPLTEVITATDWSNFYALRTEVKEDGTPVARPEVYKTAVAIRDAIEASTPTHRELHLPMIPEDQYPEESNDSLDFLVGVSAGRCAKISYGDYDWTLEDRQVGFDRSRRLLAAGHMSPFEQQAISFSDERWRLVRHLQREIRADESIVGGLESADMQRQLEYSGNLCGWVPARKSLPYEWDYGELRASMVSS